MKTMTKILTVILLAVALSVVYGCNEDEACWAPGTEGMPGEGGGPLLPGGAGGGYGAEPEPQPQAKDRWTCKGPVVDCTCDVLVGVTLSCPHIVTIDESEAAAKASARDECATDLAVKLIQVQDPKAPTPKCACASSAQMCTKAVDHDWTCNGRSTCKRGKTACKTPDEVWDGWCGYGPGEGHPTQDVAAYTAEDARQELLWDCEDELELDGGGSWFCMPGSLKCEPKAPPTTWLCSGPVSHCVGNDKYGAIHSGCAFATGAGSTEAEAQRDALDDCQAQIDNINPGKWWTCDDPTGLKCAKSN